MLADLGGLAEPRTPLVGKVVTLRSPHPDAGKARLPFSFANCLLVGGCSRLSVCDCFGFIRPDDFRDFLSWYVRRWMRETLARYPRWVRDAFRQNPQWVALRLQNE